MWRTRASVRWHTYPEARCPEARRPPTPAISCETTVAAARVDGVRGPLARRSRPRAAIGIGAVKYSPKRCESTTLSVRFDDYREKLITTINRTFTLSAALLLLATVGCAATTTRDSTGQYIDDSATTARVKAALFRDPSLKSGEISVQTFKGRVQLSGFVRSRANIEEALVDARRVPGAANVENGMHPQVETHRATAAKTQSRQSSTSSMTQ